MTTNGHRHTDRRGRRRTVLIVALAVAAIVVFAGGYVLGTGGNDVATPSPSATPSQVASTTPSETPASSATPSAEPTGDTLADGTHFVQLTDVQGGDEGPLQLQYDLAEWYTGAEANQVAASRGDETPVPNDYYIVNDNPKLRLTPLAETYVVKYIPEGSGLSEPVKATESQFLGWMGQTVQTDFPPKDTSWWWITIADGEVTTIEQKYLP